VSTHDVDFACRFAARAIVFSRGEVISDAGIEEVFASEDVLLKAGLKKPLLYAAAELLANRFPGNEAARKPRRIEELQEYIGRLK